MKKITTALALFLLFSNCEKGFEDINKNPYSPTETSMEALFNKTIESLKLGWNEQFYVHNEKLYEATQLGALTSRAWLNTAIGIDEIWNNYYGALKNIREIERRFTAFEAAGGSAEELKNVRAMLKTITAYKTFYMTDLFGDIPFFDAGRGIEDLKYLRPKYDAQELIYKTLLDDLKWAAENIEINPAATAANGKTLYSFGNFDALFKSDMKKWQRFANSLRLRHAIRMAEKDPAAAGPIIADILANNLPILKKGEDILLRPRQLDWVKESTHWSFDEHKNLRMGSTIWAQLSPQNMADGSGIIDPRAHIFFETNNAQKWADYPNLPGPVPPIEGGEPYDKFRDVNFDAKGSANHFSPFQYYLIRDGNDVPEYLMTAAELYFLKAEAYFRGIGVAENKPQAQIEYSDGISASIAFWYSVAGGTAIWQPAPTVSQGEIFGYINHPDINPFSGNFTLEKIYKQAWLDHFRQPWDAFALVRRTGKTPREGDALNYFRVTYPGSEANYNGENWSAQAAKMGGDRTDVKVWWMAN